ncbi:MAG: 8-oxo-dGTP diphosphatase MutT [Pseudomonadales bacterium]|nr:MAG: 8-oxo-dGTP diphosphatase MutT [Pseudomonadales bacterium]
MRFNQTLSSITKRYEFVGGKLEPNEKPLQALIREVAEEIGIRIDDSACHKLGEIHHDYPEKSVCLHIFGVSLDDKQFESLQPKKIGELGQPLVWVSKADLLANKYQLPDANSEILSWLRDDGDK